MTCVLPIDGGGCRGVVALAVLRRILAKVPEFLSSVDLFAGTSTGAIVACGLAHGMSPAKLLGFYADYADSIFSASFLRSIDPTSAKYSSAPLYDALTSVFGDLQLGNLQKSVLIPAFQIDGYNDDNAVRAWGPKFYNSWQDKDAKVVDVIMASTAAPTYFPMYGPMIDGGVVCNNPSAAAVIEVHDRLKVPLAEVAALSLGTGMYPRYISKHSGDFGSIAWLRYGLVDIVLDGGVVIPHHYCEKLLLSENYVRVQHQLPKELAPMDEPRNISELIRLATGTDISEAITLASRMVSLKTTEI